MIGRTLIKAIKNPRRAVKVLFDPNRTFDLTSSYFRGSSRIGTCLRPKFQTLEALINKHFELTPEHPCRATLTEALEMFSLQPINIIETGSSAWGTNSTMLFDSYVNSFGGRLNSVDLRATPMLSLKNKCTKSTTLHCNDSVTFLTNHKYKNDNPKLIYLDSWDIKWDSPIPAMAHGLAEFLTVLPELKCGDVILIDDTPRDHGVVERVQGAINRQHFLQMQKMGITGGKGSLVKDYIEFHDICEVVRHEYQLILRFKGPLNSNFKRNTH